MKTIKRVLSCLLAVVLLLSSTTVAAFAVASADMTVTTNGASTTQLKAGDTVTVKIALPGTERLAKAEVALAFDVSRLAYCAQPDGGVDTAVPDGWSRSITSQADANNNGVVTFTAEGTSNTSIGDGFNLLTLNFTVLEGVSGRAEFEVSTLSLWHFTDAGALHSKEGGHPSAQSVDILKAPITAVDVPIYALPTTGSSIPMPSQGDFGPYSSTYTWHSSMEDAVANQNPLYYASVAGSTTYVARIVCTANTAGGYQFADSVSASANGTKVCDTAPVGNQVIYYWTVTTGAKELTRIKVTTLPDKTAYIDGEVFDATGMAVTAYYNDSTSAPVTDYTVENASVPLNMESEQVVVSYTENTVTKTDEVAITMEANTLASIAVSGTFKRAYYIGEAADWSGMVITASYKRGNTASVALSDAVISGFSSAVEAEAVEITVSYTEGGITKSDTFSVSVGKRTLSAGDIETSWPSPAVYDNTAKVYTAAYAGGITQAEAGALSVTYNGSAEAPKQPGTYTVVVSAAGGTRYKAGTVKTDVVTIGKAAPTLTASDQSLVVNTERFAVAEITGVTGGAEPSGLTYSIVSGGEYLQLLDASTGKIKGLAVGSAQVKVRFAGDEYYESAEKTFTVSVTNKRSVTVAFSAVEPGYQDYDGQEYSLFSFFGSAYVSGGGGADVMLLDADSAGDDGIRYLYNNRVYTKETLIAVMVKNAGIYTVKAFYETEEEYGETSASYEIRAIEQTTALSFTPATTAFGSGVTLVPSGGDGTGAYSFEVAAGGSGGASISGAVLTPTKAGTVKVKITRAASTNYKAASRIVDFTITKAAAPGLTNGTCSFQYNKTGAKTAALPTGMPADAGTVAWSAEEGEDTDNIISGVTVENGVVKFTLASGCEPGDTASITVKAVSDNYQDASATIRVNITSKSTQPALVITSGTQMVYGSTLTLSVRGGAGSGAVSYSVVPGTGAASVSGDVLSAVKAGTVTITAHKAGDDTYEPTSSASVTVTIEKARPTGIPGYTPVTTSGKTLGEVPLTLGTISVPGEVTWVDSSTTVVEANRAYGWRFHPTDSDNYHDLTGEITPYIYRPSQNVQPTIYPVIIRDGIESGEIKADPDKGPTGEVITLTVAPAYGYRLDTLTVRDAMGKDIEVKKVDEGTYTFQITMSTAYVFATFEKAENPFSDVNGTDWFAGAVNYVYRNGLMDGVGGGLFDPDGKMTRGMLMTILARMAGVDTSGSDPWYQAGVEWAKANGVSDGTMPEAYVTREQVAVMLYRYLGGGKADGDALSSYPDGAAVSDWAVEAVNWAVSVGLLQGDDHGLLDPQGTATRAEVATMLMRMAAMEKQ